MIFKRFFVLIGVSILSVVTLNAQSAADIELAKQLARQQGYSEAQIEAMLNKQLGIAEEKTTSGTKGIDRNAASHQQILDMQYMQQLQKSNYGVAGMNGLGVSEEDGMLLLQKQGQPELLKGADLIFGHNIFKNENLNFIPSYNIPTPENYKLSAGDEVVIDIWGDVVSNITTTVSPDGSVNIPNLGPVYIGGQTIKQAERSLKQYLGRIYSGLANEEPTTFAKVSLGKTRSVTVNVVGDVVKPGSYTLPSLSTIASAMYLAEGPNDLGTIREIKLFRNNREVAVFDVYDFIINGSFDSNLRLEDNDVISVTPYKGLVTLLGGVKRPMKYEIKGGETLDKVLAYAGGFGENAFGKSVHIDRILSGNGTGAVGESFDVPAEQFATFQLKDGDVITVNTATEQYRNRVKIAGAVWYPGIYAIDGNTSNLKQLIQAAGGLREDAHTDKGFVVRFGENREKEQVSFSVTDVILGKQNIALAPDDSVQIFSRDSLQQERTVRIYGEVNNPDTFDFREGMTIGDIILMAGGLTDAATLSMVEVARRMPKPTDEKELDLSDTVAVVMQYNLLKSPADADVKLKPFDLVFVRRSTGFKPQQAITVEGEVNYPGTYVIEKNVVRLSDIISRAKGVNGDAYVAGAKLTRKLTEEEVERLEIALDIAKKQATDSTALEEMTIGESFTVAINLEKALENPGSVYDVVLREGDVIDVPKFNSTVKISGAVLLENTVTYEPNRNWKYYIANAGGTTQDGVKKKVYMVHMNGSVATKGSPNFKVQPGTEIIVPAKDRSTQGQSLSAILGIATTTASLAAMVTTIINQVK